MTQVNAQSGTGADLDRLAQALAPHGLMIAGGFHPGPDDGAPEGTRTLLMIGPDGARFWPVFAASPELADGRPHPMDRWSLRVIGGVAAAQDGLALFPFEGPPWPPFLLWAGLAEGNRPSPVGLPVSPLRGLWASYRGAVALRTRLAWPVAPFADPCLGCPAPCLTACPVGALAPSGYDVVSCAAHAQSEQGAVCRDGCLVRAACPAGEAPPLAQRRFHMRAFLRSR